MRRSRWHSERFRGFTRCRSNGYPGKHRHVRRYTRELLIDAGRPTFSDFALDLTDGPDSLLTLTRRIGRINPRRWSS